MSYFSHYYQLKYQHLQIANDCNEKNIYSDTKNYRSISVAEWHQEASHNLTITVLLLTMGERKGERVRRKLTWHGIGVNERTRLDDNSNLSVFYLLIIHTLVIIIIACESFTLIIGNDQRAVIRKALFGTKTNEQIKQKKSEILALNHGHLSCRVVVGEAEELSSSMSSHLNCELWIIMHN